MSRQSLVFQIPANDLLPGAYTVTAQHDDFQAATVSPIFVEINRKTLLDFDPRVGSVHETATFCMEPMRDHENK
jgi:hypothetical protein